MRCGMEVNMVGHTISYIPVRVGITDTQMEKLKTTASGTVEDEIEKLVISAVKSILGD